MISDYNIVVRYHNMMTGAILYNLLQNAYAISYRYQIKISVSDIIIKEGCFLLQCIMISCNRTCIIY